MPTWSSAPAPRARRPAVPGAGLEVGGGQVGERVALVDTARTSTIRPRPRRWTTAPAPLGQEALARPGRYHGAAGNLEVKEVVVGEGERRQRFVVCHNPEAAERDQQVRANLVAHLTTQIEGADGWTTSKRDEPAGRLRTTPALWRLVRRLSDGRFRIDRAAIARVQKLDGKWLLRTSDDSLTPTDLAVAYKQLLEVERGWRDMKGSLGLRPVFHHREDRIRSHVQLCWLGLPLIRVVENSTGDTWRNVRNAASAAAPL